MKSAFRPEPSPARRWLGCRGQGLLEMSQADTGEGGEFSPGQPREDEILGKRRLNGTTWVLQSPFPG